MLPSRRGGPCWFDGYLGEEVALFDDFYGQIDIKMMLRLCDRYPLRTQVKGGTAMWRPRKVYITSNHPPDEWWTEVGDQTSVAQREAFMRRVTSVTHKIHPVVPGVPIVRVDAFVGNPP